MSETETGGDMDEAEVLAVDELVAAAAIASGRVSPEDSRAYILWVREHNARMKTWNKLQREWMF